MSQRIKPVSVIRAELGINPGGKVCKFLTETCAIHMDKYVPYDRGNLSNYYIEGNSIVYDQLYAEYQYNGMREDGSYVINPEKRNRAMHPLATSHWDRKMVTAEMPDVIKEVQDYIKVKGNG